MPMRLMAFIASQGRLLLFREQIGDFVPYGHEYKLIDRHAFLEQVARVDVDAVRAAIQLRYPKEYKVNQP